MDYGRMRDGLDQEVDVVKDIVERHLETPQEEKVHRMALVVCCGNMSKKNHSAIHIKNKTTMHGLDAMYRKRQLSKGRRTAKLPFQTGMSCFTRACT